MRVGTGIAEFRSRFPDDAACRRHILLCRWGEIKPCPRCGLSGDWKPLGNGKQYIHRCKYRINPLKDTMFYRSHVPLQTSFYAFLLFGNSSFGVRCGFLGRQAGLTFTSAFRLCDRVRVRMAACARVLMVGGPGRRVYVDEVRLSNRTWKSERVVSPVIVMGFACEGQVRCCEVPDRKTQTLLTSIDRFVRPGSTIITDAHTGYRPLSSRGWSHIVVNHSVAFHNFRGDTTNEIEIFWGHLRRLLAAHHGIGRENLWKYVAEAELRYNRRHSKVSLFDELVSEFPDFDAEGVEMLRRQFVWQRR